MLDIKSLPLVTDELRVLEELVPLDGRRIIELGCGDAKVSRDALLRHPDCQITALEVDAVQHAKNLARPQAGITFVAAGAEAVPCPDASFDLAMMLKSLHHVPMPSMATALSEVARVLRPGALFYVAEPVYQGDLNEVMKLFNDEGVTRAAAQAALDTALAKTGHWEAVTERHYAVPVGYRSFDEFEQRMMRPSYADHKLDDAKIARVREAFMPHCTADGAKFLRPMHVRLLRRKG